MSKILLDYVFPITVITPTAEASTSFLKQLCLVVKPKSGQEGNVGEIYECTNMTQVAERTDNENAEEAFSAGMSKVFILLADDLDIGDYLQDYLSSFYTVLISDDFVDNDFIIDASTGTITVTNYENLVSDTDDSVTIEGVTFTAQAGAVTPGQTTFQAATSNEATAASLAAQINAHTATAALVTATVEGAVVTLTADNTGITDVDVSYTDNDTNVGITLAGLTGGALSGGGGLFLGLFKGVVGVSTQDATVADAQNVIANRCAFLTDSTNKAKNMVFAFGSLLSNPTNWLNQQYIEMPYDDGIDELGDAETYFEDRISFVLNDTEYGNRLAFFGAGGKAIVAPYILKNLCINLQSAALQWISGNQPQYTLKNAALLEARLQEDVINEFIRLTWITAGTVEVTLVDDNFVANGSINISEPTAMWRVESELRQTL